MVTYLPSEARGMINVYIEEVATLLTAVIPTDVLVGEGIRIGGQLRRADTNQIMPSETITATYNGTVLGTDVTAGDGSYNIDGVITVPGSYPVRVFFAGSERSGLVFAGSEVLARLGVGITEMDLWVKTALILGAAAVIGFGVGAFTRKM